MKHLFKNTIGIVFLVFLLSVGWVHAEGAPIKGEMPVIVIDPGHGGKNLGTEGNQTFPGGILEKEMDLITAKAMYQELQAFDQVTVYLTRDSDQDITIKERAVFAASVDADYMFSIHYNASEAHDQFGAEVWVPLRAPFNGYGYQFGSILLRDLEEIGLLNCGVKTRLGEKSKDYYGIIREAYARDIPSFIIEHCHVDEQRDTSYCDSVEDMELLGRMDAHSVAKFLGLKSEKLGVDYSSHTLVPIDSKNAVPITLQDTTAPSLCLLEVLNTDVSACKISAHLLAQDEESPILYYAYSLDGGLTFSERYEWPNVDCLLGVSDEVLEIELDIPSGVRPNVIFRVFNMYGLSLDSNVYCSDVTFQVPAPSESVEKEISIETMKEVKYELHKVEEGTLSVQNILKVSLLGVLLIALLFGVSCIIARKGKHNRK